MSGKGLSRKIYDPANPPFSEPLLKLIGNDGILSYRVKCIAIGPLFYLVGLLVTLLSGTFAIFVSDYAFCIACLMSGVNLYVILHACKQVDSTIGELNNILHYTTDEKFSSFINWAKNESPRRYYLWVIIPVLFLVIAGTLGYIGPPWVKEVQLSAYLPNKMYYLSWCILMGYLLGVGFNRINRYAHTIYNFSAMFCKPSRIKIFSQDGLGGLRPLTKLALKINMATALPGFVGVVYLMKSWTERGYPIIALPSYALMAFVYFIVLVCIFIFPLWPVHKAMVTAKNRAQKQIDNIVEKIEFSDVDKIDIDSVDLLSKTLSIREKISKMSTWPLNFGLFIKFVTTGICPIIVGALIQIFLERLIT